MNEYTEQRVNSMAARAMWGTLLAGRVMLRAHNLSIFI
jgi:hypothetical protein